MTRRKTLALALALGIASLAAAPAVAAARDIGKATRLCTEADKVLQNGDTEKGRLLFGKALEAVPDFPDAHTGLGQMAMVERRYEDALREFEAARDAYARFGEILFDVRMQQFTKTRDEISMLQDSLAQIREGAMFARPSGGGGTVLDQAKIENRIQQLEGVPEPRKEEAAEPPAEIFFLIGNAQFRLSRLDAAAASYEECIRRNPKHLPSYTNLALALGSAGKIEEARAAIARAEAAGLKPDPKLKSDLGAK